LHRKFGYRIEVLKINLSLPKVSAVEVVEIAKPPQFSVGSNRWFGAALLIVGFFPTFGRLLLLKSSNRKSA